MAKTILVATDGSVASNNSLDYLAALFAADPDLVVHLLAVVPSGGGGKEWMYDVDPLRSQSPEAEKRARVAKKHLEEAAERLSRQGFVRQRLTTSVKIATSVCGAIREEAERGGYDSVVIGRRGLGSVGSMFFGSISAELLTTCHRVPLWIIDGRAQAGRFLLAVHSHPSSLLAADHLAYILKDIPNAEICLYHSNSVFGGHPPAAAEAFHPQWGKDWCDQYLDLDNFLFYAHFQLLVEGGIPRHRIRQLPTQMHLDVGSDLLRQAKQHHCGTVVIGRRRRDLQRGQLKGVSDKTLKQAQDIAVWLAG